MSKKDLTQSNIGEFQPDVKREMRSAERVFWDLVKDRQLGVEFIWQHKMDDYVVNFCCPEGHLVVDIQANNKSKEEVVYDINRTLYLEINGYQVLSFEDGNLYNTPRDVFDKIGEHLSQQGLKVSIPQDDKIRQVIEQHPRDSASINEPQKTRIEFYKPAQELPPEKAKLMTQAHKFLWMVMKDERLGSKFEYKHKVGDDTYDFVCVDGKAAINVVKEYDDNRIMMARDRLSRQGEGYELLEVTEKDLQEIPFNFFTRLVDYIRSQNVTCKLPTAFEIEKALSKYPIIEGVEAVARFKADNPEEEETQDKKASPASKPQASQQPQAKAQPQQKPQAAQTGKTDPAMEDLFANPPEQKLKTGASAIKPKVPEFESAPQEKKDTGDDSFMFELLMESDDPDAKPIQDEVKSYEQESRMRQAKEFTRSLVEDEDNYVSPSEREGKSETLMEIDFFDAQSSDSGDDSVQGAQGSQDETKADAPASTGTADGEPQQKRKPVFFDAKTGARDDEPAKAEVAMDGIAGGDSSESFDIDIDKNGKGSTGADVAGSSTEGGDDLFASLDEDYGKKIEINKQEAERKLKEVREKELASIKAEKESGRSDVKSSHGNSTEEGEDIFAELEKNRNNELRSRKGDEDVFGVGGDEKETPDVMLEPMGEGEVIDDGMLELVFIDDDEEEESVVEDLDKEEERTFPEEDDLFADDGESSAPEMKEVAKGAAPAEAKADAAAGEEHSFDLFGDDSKHEEGTALFKHDEEEAAPANVTKHDVEDDVISGIEVEHADSGSQAPANEEPAQVVEESHEAASEPEESKATEEAPIATAASSDEDYEPVIELHVDESGEESKSMEEAKNLKDGKLREIESRMASSEDAIEAFDFADDDGPGIEIKSTKAKEETDGRDNTLQALFDEVKEDVKASLGDKGEHAASLTEQTKAEEPATAHDDFEIEVEGKSEEPQGEEPKETAKTQAAGSDEPVNVVEAVIGDDDNDFIQVISESEVSGSEAAKETESTIKEAETPEVSKDAQNIVSQLLDEDDNGISKAIEADAPTEEGISVFDFDDSAEGEPKAEEAKVEAKEESKEESKEEAKTESKPASEEEETLVSIDETGAEVQLETDEPDVVMEAEPGKDAKSEEPVAEAKEEAPKETIGSIISEVAEEVKEETKGESFAEQFAKTHGIDTTEVAEGGIQGLKEIPELQSIDEAEEIIVEESSPEKKEEAPKAEETAKTETQPEPKAEEPKEEKSDSVILSETKIEGEEEAILISQPVKQEETAQEETHQKKHKKFAGLDLQDWLQSKAKAKDHEVKREETEEERILREKEEAFLLAEAKASIGKPELDPDFYDPVKKAQVIPEELLERKRHGIETTDLDAVEHEKELQEEEAHKSNTVVLEQDIEIPMYESSISTQPNVHIPTPNLEGGLGGDSVPQAVPVPVPKPVAGGQPLKPLSAGLDRPQEPAAQPMQPKEEKAPSVEEMLNSEPTPEELAAISVFGGAKPKGAGQMRGFFAHDPEEADFGQSKADQQQAKAQANYEAWLKNRKEGEGAEEEARGGKRVFKLDPDLNEKIARERFEKEQEEEAYRREKERIEREAEEEARLIAEKSRQDAGYARTGDFQGSSFAAQPEAANVPAYERRGTSKLQDYLTRSASKNTKANIDGYVIGSERNIKSVLKVHLPQHKPAEFGPIEISSTIVDQDLPALFSGCRILVVGDVMLDRYWFGEAERISPEAPVPVTKIEKREIRAGGAANVARNIVELGGKVELLSVIGDDDAGHELLHLMQDNSIDAKLIADPTISTTIRLRVIAKNQQLIRLDFENTPNHEVLRQIMVYYRQQVENCDAVILSDYGKGGLTHVTEMIELAKIHNKPVLIDPKGTDYLRYKGATLISPNKKELADVVGQWRNEAELREKANQLRATLQADKLLLTRSEEGMSLYYGENSVTQSTEAQEVYDVSGAGDTVIACMGLCMSAGIDEVLAMKIANAAAGVVVNKLGTSVCTIDELLEKKPINSSFD